MSEWGLRSLFPALVMAAVLVGVAACDSGSDSASDVDGSDPESVGVAFIEDAAAGRAEACQLLTEAADERLLEVTRAEDCEDAIGSIDDTSSSVFCVGDPEALTDALPDARLESATNGETEFRISPSNGAEITLTMVESGDDRRIDLIAWGVTETVGPGQPRVDPCEAA